MTQEEQGKIQAIIKPPPSTILDLLLLKEGLVRLDRLIAICIIGVKYDISNSCPYINMFNLLDLAQQITINIRRVSYQPKFDLLLIGKEEQLVELPKGYIRPILEVLAIEETNTIPQSHNRYQISLTINTTSVHKTKRASKVVLDKSSCLQMPLLNYKLKNVYLTY